MGPSGSPVFEEEATSAPPPPPPAFRGSLGEGNFEPNFVALVVAREKWEEVGGSIKFEGGGESNGSDNLSVGGRRG